MSDADRAKLRESQLAKCAQLRKMYNDAGVNIHIHKLPFGPSDDDIDFNFEVAKALGCMAITTERSDRQAKRLAPFADKHKIWVAFHNHTNNTPTIDKTDPLLNFGQYIGFNFDIGHYFAGTKGKSPIPVIEKYHDRIVSLHLKDRTADGGNLPWGKGQTPIKEVLQLMKKEKWTFPADIEVEYRDSAGLRPRWRKWPSACNTARIRSLEAERRHGGKGRMMPESKAKANGKQATRVGQRVHVSAEAQGSALPRHP